MPPPGYGQARRSFFLSLSQPRTLEQVVEPIQREISPLSPDSRGGELSSDLDSPVHRAFVRSTPGEEGVSMLLDR